MSSRLRLRKQTPRNCFTRTDILMDKKIKKKTHVLQQRIKSLRQQLSGVKKQMDDPEELTSLERQLAAAESELAKLKA